MWRVALFGTLRNTVNVTEGPSRDSLQMAGTAPLSFSREGSSPKAGTLDPARSRVELGRPADALNERNEAYNPKARNKVPRTVSDAGQVALHVAGHQLSTGFDHFRVLEDGFPHHASVPNRCSGKNRTRLLRGAGR